MGMEQFDWLLVALCTYTCSIHVYGINTYELVNTWLTID